MGKTKKKKNILVLVEGEKTDVAVMQQLFLLYLELDSSYQIVPYRTNIYVLYELFFKDVADPDSIALLQGLKSREPDTARKAIFDEKYTDVLLIFDLDPQDTLYSSEKIQSLQEYFVESSDMGRLYINYPMVEAFYHMSSIPDPGYLSRRVTIDELKKKTYKAGVNQESKGHSYRKFITNRAECNTVIRQNIEKAAYILGENTRDNMTKSMSPSAVLTTQLSALSDGYLHVPCTCPSFVFEYNPSLVF